MSVYVDDLQIWPNVGGIFCAGSCHMAADTLEELHEMALKIGMKRAWLPPGYTVRFEDSLGANGDGPPFWWYGAPHYLASMGSEVEALAAAWAHYKAHNDPPGLEVMDDGPVGWGFQVLRMRTWPMPGTRPVREFHIIDGGQVARAAAWAWHDRRHRLIERGLAHRGRGWMGLNPWPRCLTWSDPHVAAVERWLVDSTVEMPEVLRG